MSQTNNVNLDGMAVFAEQIQQDPTKAKRTQVIEGEWVLGAGGPQFVSTISYEGGTATFETDNPTFMGGTGTLPGPMHYCFFGLASCYTGVFASMAASLGVEIKSLTTRVEADIDFSKVFGLGDEPIMEEVRITLQVVTDSPEEKVRDAESLALERCPVVFTLSNIVKLTPGLEIVPLRPSL
ncbi:MAG: OsmC family protein [Armatimonadetes bacterium]|nr:OsmC family protein [Armatimonadota bacterium]